MALYATVQPSFSGFACSRNSGFYNRPDISVTAESGGLKVKTPYNASFVEQLKSQIPSTNRKWDNSTKCWYVSRDHADALKQIIDSCYSCDVQMPTVIAEASETFTVTFQADYVANCKNEASSVHANGDWAAKIPEKVLRAWFKQADKGENATLYGLLGCSQRDTPEQIKKAFKRAARQWHPDICKEPDAREMFEKVKAASETLLDPISRNKYNAGLAFEKLAKGSRHSRDSRFASFTPVLRCGNLTVKAKRELGVLIVEEILAWEDIENEFGQVMVSFWAGDSFSLMWV